MTMPALLPALIPAGDPAVVPPPPPPLTPPTISAQAICGCCDCELPGQVPAIELTVTSV